MATATIKAGICGFTTVIVATVDDDENTTFTVNTDCPNYRPLDGRCFDVDAYQLLAQKVGRGAVYETFRPHCPHAACPVPSGAMKAIEVAAGIALPRDAHIQVQS